MIPYYSESFETWGVTDAMSWVGVGEHPLLYDEKYLPKLARIALEETLKGNKTFVDKYYERIKRPSFMTILDEA
jgi:hypothetical protein